jgi:hypothetical protein
MVILCAELSRNSSYVCAKKENIFLFILCTGISEIFCGVALGIGHPSQSDHCLPPVEQMPPNDVHPCHCSEPPEIREAELGREAQRYQEQLHVISKYTSLLLTTRTGIGRIECP